MTGEYQNVKLAWKTLIPQSGIPNSVFYLRWPSELQARTVTPFLFCFKNIMWQFLEMKIFNQCEILPYNQQDMPL